MPRARSARPWLVALVLVGLGCSAPAQRGVRLAPGDRAEAAPLRLDPRVVARRGALSYQSAFLGERLWLATELATRFELVVRRVDRHSRAVVELGRVDLGPSDWNTTGLAVAARGPRVWVSSLAGHVRAIDVETMRVTSEWRTGEGATAVAVDQGGRHVAYGTASGVLCLRRARDGALLQCVSEHRGPIEAIAFDGARLHSAGAGSLVTWSLPALRIESRRPLDASVAAMAPSADGLAVALGKPDPRAAERGALVVFRDGQRLLCAEEQAIASLAWAPGSALITASVDGAVRLWRVGEGCAPTSERRLAQPAWSVASSPSGAVVAIGLWARALEQPTAVLADVLYPVEPEKH